MKQRFTAPYILTLAFAVLAAGLRLWGLLTAVDIRGLPVMALPVYFLIGAAAVFVCLAAALAHISPGRSGNRRCLRYGSRGMACGMLAAGLILAGACTEFGEALLSGPGISDPIICLLGLAGSACCFGVAWARGHGRTCHPAAELMPVLYLLVKLMLNFKSWSTDPIILDYCFKLFALIFVLLAVYQGAGFQFDQGKPRKTLFYGMLAVFFCAAAIMDGVMDLRPSTVIGYSGYLLWQLPVIWAVLLPSEPDPAPEQKKKKSGRRRDKGASDA